MLDVQACDILTGLTGLLLASSLVLAVVGLSGWIGMELRYRSIKRLADRDAKERDAFWGNFSERARAALAPAAEQARVEVER